MSSSFGAYRRVFMLGIDGMGAFNRLADTPCMDALFAGGATTYTAMSARPTISGQCWTSMLTGALPEVHGLSNGNMHPIAGLPTVFGIIREARPEAETAVFSDWAPIAMQIVSPIGGASHYDTAPDDELTEDILAYLDDHDPMFLFVQFDSVDGAGHHSYYGSPSYLERIAHVDGLLGRLVEKYRQRGFFEDTLFLVTADHGGTPHHTHGGWSPAEREIFFGAAGKTVTPGTIGEASLRDFPAVVLHALGIEAPAFDPKGYAAQMPCGIFEGAGVTDRQELFSPPPRYPQREEPLPGAPGHIDTYLPPEDTLLRIPFEGDARDVTGRCTVEEAPGTVKYYSTGIRGGCGEVGFAPVPIRGLPTPEVFSISLWYIFSPDNAGWIDLLSTRDGEHPCFVLRPGDDGVGILLLDPDETKRLWLDVSGETAERPEGPGWCHYLFTVNVRENTLSARANFGAEKTVRPDFPLAPFFDLSRLVLAHRVKMEGVCKMVDDLIITRGAASADALREYYVGGNDQ